MYSDMDIDELFARLDDEQAGSFPEDLVAEVIARREEVTPRLLGILEDIDRNPQPWLADGDRMLHIWAFYLLALFRETRAYPLLARIFSRPGEFGYELAGDVLTQDLGRILASVSGGDVSEMKDLIENEQANEYVRSLAMDGMVSLVNTGQRTRDEVMAYFLELFHKLERKPGVQWDGLANACTDLWPQEALQELEQAYKAGLVDPFSIAWKDVEDALALGQQGAMRQACNREPLITDLAKDMGWMQCFCQPPPKDRQKKEYEADPSGLVKPSSDHLESFPSNSATAPVRRNVPKVGRNQPCPCGSGKKFKKCCGVG